MIIEEPKWKAFPQYSNTTDGGMTLRDYFAAKAMENVMKEWAKDRHEQGESCFEDDLKLMAEDCYRMADAMLEARKKR